MWFSQLKTRQFRAYATRTSANGGEGGVSQKRTKPDVILRGEGGGRALSDVRISLLNISHFSNKNSLKIIFFLIAHHYFYDYEISHHLPIILFQTVFPITDCCPQQQASRNGFLLSMSNCLIFTIKTNCLLITRGE